MKRTGISLITVICLLATLFQNFPAAAEEKRALRVGVASVYSGDFANLGQNIRRTVETYQRHKLRHALEFDFEDAGISSQDGLRAYQALINVRKVDFLIGATSSNGTMAGAPLINSSRTVMITPVTGGSNVDNAGDYIFRIGNSDVLNGINQAELFKSEKFRRVALLTEETEYTDDIARHFRRRFSELGGVLVSDQSFTPGTTDFKAMISRLLASKSEAIFLPTQTGVALALFLKQLHELGAYKGQIHTTFVAASNPDAARLAGDLLHGVRFMKPACDPANPALADFVKLYRGDHGTDPDILFHTAGTVDALDMLQNYLDKNAYDRKGFQQYLLTNVKDYSGLMGTYSFDSKGNADLGFERAAIE